MQRPAHGYWGFIRTKGLAMMIYATQQPAPPAPPADATAPLSRWPVKLFALKFHFACLSESGAKHKRKLVYQLEPQMLYETPQKWVSCFWQHMWRGRNTWHNVIKLLLLSVSLIVLFLISNQFDVGYSVFQQHQVGGTRNGNVFCL